MDAGTPHRCGWAEGDPLLRAYHDEEWSVPEYDSRALWEKLMLDGFQAGLSWLTILRKRHAFRKGFKNFDPEKVARFGEIDIAKLLANADIVRSRAKIEATIVGARAYLAMRDAGEDSSTFIWDMVGGSPIRNSGDAEGERLASAATDECIHDRRLKKRQAQRLRQRRSMSVRSQIFLYRFCTRRLLLMLLRTSATF
jgi:DNA-3-methyladenine glycosylase I